MRTSPDERALDVLIAIEVETRTRGRPPTADEIADWLGERRRLVAKTLAYAGKSSRSALGAWVKEDGGGYILTDSGGVRLRAEQK